MTPFLVYPSWDVLGLGEVPGVSPLATGSRVPRCLEDGTRHRNRRRSVRPGVNDSYVVFLLRMEGVPTSGILFRGGTEEGGKGTSTSLPRSI